MREGHGVFVPFGQQVLQGVVLALTDTPRVEDTREILSLLDAERLLTPAQARLARWLMAHYLAPAWSAVAPFLPPGFERKPRRQVAAVADDPPAVSLTGRERLVLAHLRRRGETSVDALTRALGGDAGGREGLLRVLRSLREHAVIEDRYTLAPPAVREKTETVLTLAVGETAARHALAAWPRSKRSRPADLLEALAGGPLPLDAARRLLGGRAAFDRFAAASTLFIVVPAPVATSDSPTVRAAADPATLAAAADALRRTRAEQAQVAVLHTLLDGPRPEPALRKATGAARADLAALDAAGLLRREIRHVERHPLIGGPSAPQPAPPLTRQQAAADRAIGAAFDAARDRRTRAVLDQEPGGACLLLHGVTGSGKTEIYLAAIDRVIAHGGRAIFLVPEIALAPQTVRRVSARFPGRVAVLHSGLGAGEAYDQWQRIRRGGADVVIGSRSALFAPLPSLALIIVDEEHEWTYKQEDPAPRYHVRDTAERYADLAGLTVIFGTATPDLVTAARAHAGRYQTLTLSQRVRRADHADPAAPLLATPLPSIEIVDLREELRAGNRSIFSRSLHAAIDGALAAGEQVMLFLNRRGAESYVCRDCGEALTCSRCSVPLTYHAPEALLRCHECGRTAALPDRCPACGRPRIRPMGLGTQRLEGAVVATFPAARPLRWDRDTAAGRNGHQRLLDRFLRGEANVLVGTQMIAKGLDLPSVTVVGVVNADLSLRLPDYTGPERTFQLLTQVAGRAGRGPRGGRVVFQTYAPNHYAIVAAAAHDFESFYEAEMAARRPFGYPPFGRLARLVLQGADRARAHRDATDLAERLRTEVLRLGLPDTEVLGPTPAFIERRRGRYRWQITLRGGDPLPLLRDLTLGPQWTVDMDPVSLL